MQQHLEIADFSNNIFCLNRLVEVYIPSCADNGLFDLVKTHWNPCKEGPAAHPFSSMDEKSTSSLKLSQF